MIRLTRVVGAIGFAAIFSLVAMATAAALVPGSFTGTTAPTNPQIGQIWNDTSGGSTQVVRSWDGSQWVSQGVLNATTHVWAPTLTGITPSQFGAVNKAGDTMTGALGVLAPASTDNGTSAVSSAWVKQFFPGLNVSLPGFGTPGMEGEFAFDDFNALTGSNTLRVQRRANYTSAAPNIATNFQAVTTVTPNVPLGPGEWNILGVMHDQSQGGGHVGIYGQYNQESAGATGWAGTLEARDAFTPDGGTPTKGHVGLEADSFGDGLDTSFLRYGIIVVAGHNTGSAPQSSGTGISIGPQGGCTNCQFRVGVNVYGAGDAAFQSVNSTAGYSLKTAAAQKMSFDGVLAQHYLQYGGGLFGYYIGGNYQFQQFDNAEFRLPSLAADPATGHQGGVYLNTVDKSLRAFDGTTWNPQVVANVAQSNVAGGPSTFAPNDGQGGNAFNTAMGIGALSGKPNTTENTAFGANVLQAHTGSTGGGSSGLGRNALRNVTSGGFMTGVGSNAGRAFTTGTANTVTGHGSAGQDDTTPATSTGSYHSFYGAWSGQEITTGNADTFLGTSSGLNVTTGSDDLFAGFLAGAGSNTGAASSTTPTTSSRSVALGSRAGQLLNANNVTLAGYSAGATLTTGGTQSVGSGDFALPNSITGIQNTAVGSGAGPSSDFSNTIAIGYQAQPTTSNQAVIGNAATTAFKVGTAVGVSCSGVPTSSFAVVNGIVTHC